MRIGDDMGCDFHGFFLGDVTHRNGIFFHESCNVPPQL
jgi:hypothetical protein